MEESDKRIAVAFSKNVHLSGLSPDLHKYFYQLGKYKKFIKSLGLERRKTRGQICHDFITD